MRNPLAKPETPEQWLLGSVCWTVGLVGGWLIIDYFMNYEVNSGYSTRDTVLCYYFWPAHLLIWWRAVWGGLRWLQPRLGNSVVFSLVSDVWLVLLTVFQIFTLLLGLLMTAFILFPSSHFQD